MHQKNVRTKRDLIGFQVRSLFLPVKTGDKCYVNVIVVSMSWLLAEQRINAFPDVLIVSYTLSLSNLWCGFFLTFLTHLWSFLYTLVCLHLCFFSIKIMLIHYKYIFLISSTMKSNLETAFHVLFAQLAQMIIIGIVSFPHSPKDWLAKRKKLQTISKYCAKYLGWVFFFCK